MPNLSILTIAIPTRNRAVFLAQNLLQLKSELQDIESSLVEIIVSDNSSSDETEAVVNSIMKAGLAITYIKNSIDIGWGKNFLQCFDMASGKYVLILGDDDFFVDGALYKLINYLKTDDYGVICVKTFGFDYCFKSENPGGASASQVYYDPGRFINDVGALLSLISACVINKNLASSASLELDDSPNLPILQLVLRASIASEKNLYLKEYMIGCKRNNSSNYNFSEIFVDEMWGIICKECTGLVSNAWIERLEKKMLIEYYPIYLLQIRIGDDGATNSNQQIFERRFGLSTLYKYWIKPIFILPRFLAIAYGLMLTLIGRVLGGDFRRGLHFVKYRLNRLIK
jgi:abequosyltransferase